MPNYGDLYSSAGDQSNIDPLLLQAMAGKESSEDARAVGPPVRLPDGRVVNARGLMQFLPDTAAKYNVDVSDPRSSVEGAARYMDELMHQHGQALPDALATYGGTTRDSPYVKDTLKRYNGLVLAWTGKNPQKQPPANTPTFLAGEKPLTSGQAAAAPGGGASVDIDVAPPRSIADLPLDEPATPAPAGGAQKGNQSIADLPLDEPVTPAKPTQYLSAATSPGAKAVGMHIAEDRVPGVDPKTGRDFQANINIATDPAQKMRIAANELFPNDPNALNRIIIGPDGRLAAVDEKGPFYIEPQRVLSSTEGVTRGAPGTPWEPTSPFASTPYGQWGREPINLSPGNIGRAISSQIPNVLTNVGSWAGAPLEAVNPLLGAAAVAGTTALAEGARQYSANRLDPNRLLAPDIVSSQTAQDAAENALALLGLRAGGALFRTPPAGVSLTERSRLGGPAFGEEHPLARQTQFPGQPPREIGPSEAATARPALAGGGEPAPSVQLNPAGEAAAEKGPYAASTHAEIANIPEALPPLRTPIFTKQAAEERADQIIRWFAANGPKEADARQLVPGSPGTLAQITGNAGLATLERAVRNIPEAANIFDALDVAQQRARQKAVSSLVGTPEELERLYAAREASTSKAREAAFSDTTATSPAAAVTEIDKVLAGPEGKRPGISGPLQVLRRLFYTGDAETGGQILDTDPAMLYGVRKAITDALSPLARGTEADARVAASVLQPVLQKLDAAIEAGAPGYADYMKSFAEQSKPINAMEYLQGRNLTDAQGNTTLQKIDLLLKDIERQRTLQAGARPADALSSDQITALHDLRDDLRRQANLAKGKALGSNTVQNLASNMAMNLLTKPAAHLIGRGAAITFGGLPGYIAEQGVENVLTGVAAKGEGQVRQALLDRLLNKNGLGEQALSGVSRTPPSLGGR